MEVTGHCHCGKIRYRSIADPEKISLCHCLDCQMMSGSAYRVSAHTSVKDFQLLAGEPKIYIKTGDSGKKRVQAFCGDCGSPLYAEDVTNPTIRSLRVGSLDQRAALKPKRQIWCRSALPWSHNISDLTPRLDKQ